MGLFFSVIAKGLDPFLDQTAAQTAGAYFQRARFSFHNGFHRHEIRTEDPLGAHTDMLAYTTLLLRLAFPGDDVS